MPTSNRLAWLFFLFITVVFFVASPVAHAQISVPAVAPPGSTATDIATFVGWFRFIFGLIAVILFIVACISIAKHPAQGLIELVGVIFCIVVAANAQSLVTAMYHSGSG